MGLAPSTDLHGPSTVYQPTWYGPSINPNVPSKNLHWLPEDRSATATQLRLGHGQVCRLLVGVHTPAQCHACAVGVVGLQSLAAVHYITWGLTVNAIIVAVM